MKRIRTIAVISIIIVILFTLVGCPALFNEPPKKPTVTFAKCLGGKDYDYARTIQQTSDGGYIVAGSTGSNDRDATGNHGNLDYWIVKLESE